MSSVSPTRAAPASPGSSGLPTTRAGAAVYGDELRALLGEIAADFRELAKQLDD